jgi:hypothetical protein
VRLHSSTTFNNGTFALGFKIDEISNENDALMTPESDGAAAVKDLIRRDVSVSAGGADLWAVDPKVVMAEEVWR